jgi:hypothetical protein
MEYKLNNIKDIINYHELLEIKIMKNSIFNKILFIFYF